MGGTAGRTTMLGEGLQRPDLSTGDGIYKSTDAGKTWKHLGLRDGQQISGIAIDPHDPNRVFAAGLGHPGTVAMPWSAPEYDHDLLKPIPFDMDQARAWMTKAGYTY